MVIQNGITPILNISISPRSDDKDSDQKMFFSHFMTIRKFVKNSPIIITIS
jgi:hypothetical protein